MLSSDLEEMQGLGAALTDSTSVIQFQLLLLSMIIGLEDGYTHFLCVMYLNVSYVYVTLMRNSPPPIWNTLHFKIIHVYTLGLYWVSFWHWSLFSLFDLYNFLNSRLGCLNGP